MKQLTTKIIDKISNKGYPTNNKCYSQAHKQSNKAEIKQYGKRRFNKLNKLIKTIIPKDELAGKHTRQNTILISKKIPVKYRNQIKFHELVELNNMKSVKHEQNNHIMKYLVTGGAGFIGSNLTEKLINDKHKVIVIDNLSTGNLENLSLIKSKIEFIKIPVSKILENKKIRKIDGIFHFGIPSSTPLYRKNPYFTGEAINEFITILELAKRENCKIVYASSSSIYNGNQIPFKEDMSVFVKDLYSEARYYMERLAKLYYDWYNVKSIGLRFFSVYGKHEESKKKFANLVTQFLWNVNKKQIPLIYGDGNQTRDFTYVKDIVEGCILSMNSSIDHDIFNLGSGNHFTLNEMVKILGNLTNKKIECKYINNPLKGYVQDTLCDTTKAEKQLHYRTKYSIEKGMKEIIQYYNFNQK